MKEYSAGCLDLIIKALQNMGALFFLFSKSKIPLFNFLIWKENSLAFNTIFPT